MSVKVLRKYQKQTLRFLSKRNFGGIFLQMRMGKSVIAIRRAKAVLGKDKNKKVLIVAPLGAFIGWEKEVKGEGFVLASFWAKTPKQRYKKFEEQIEHHQFFIINPAFHTSFPELANYNWDMIIFDEAQSLMEPRNKISKFMIKEFTHVPYKLALTGTPRDKSDLDIIPIILFLDSHRTIIKEKDFWEFRAKHCQSAGFSWKIRARSQEYLQYILAHTGFFMTRKQAGIKLETEIQIRELTLPAKAQTIYNKVEKEWVLESKGKEIDSKWVLEKHKWLRQICGGIVKGEIIHKAKIQEIKNLVDSGLKDKPFIVWANYKDEITLIQKELSAYGLRSSVINGDVVGEERKKVLANFDGGKLNCIIIQPQTMTVGTDLSTADTAIFYSMIDGTIGWSQAKDRILSIEHSDELLTIILTMKGTIEPEVVRGVMNGQSMTHIAMSNVRKLQKKKGII